MSQGKRLSGMYICGRHPLANTFTSFVWVMCELDSLPRAIEGGYADAILNRYPEPVVEQSTLALHLR